MLAKHEIVGNICSDIKGVQTKYAKATQEINFTKGLESTRKNYDPITDLKSFDAMGSQENKEIHSLFQSGNLKKLIRNFRGSQLLDLILSKSIKKLSRNLVIHYFGSHCMVKNEA